MSDVILFFPKVKEDGSSAFLPANLLMVAAPLVAKGVSVKIIDQRTDENWREILLEELKREPLVAGFTSLTGKQLLYALEASKIVRENSRAKIVWGGIHASLLPEQTLENGCIDIVVVGEGEETFSELYGRLKDGRPYEDVLGLAYRKDGKIFVNPPRSFINLDSLPELPYHLIKMEKYISSKSFASGRPAKNIFFFTSRGCPHHCGFCYNEGFNKRRWRGMSAERTFKEIKRLYDEYGVTAFDIEDDEFFTDLARVKKFCGLVIQNNLKIEIFTSCRLNYLDRMDDDYLELIKKAGFLILSFGVETGSERMLKFVDKDITIEQVLRGVARLQKAGIGSKYYFMVGFPTETIEDMYATTDLMQKMKQISPGIRIPQWRVYAPYAGTLLYILSQEHGFVPPVSIAEWSKFEYSVINTPWITPKMRRIVENVIFLLKYLEVDKSDGPAWLTKLYSKTINWRWKRHWLGFVPEKKIIEKILSLKYGGR